MAAPGADDEEDQDPVGQAVVREFAHSRTRAPGNPPRSDREALDAGRMHELESMRGVNRLRLFPEESARLPIWRAEGPEAPSARAAWEAWVHRAGSSFREDLLGYRAGTQRELLDSMRRDNEVARRLDLGAETFRRWMEEMIHDRPLRDPRVYRLDENPYLVDPRIWEDEARAARERSERGEPPEPPEFIVVDGDLIIWATYGEEPEPPGLPYFMHAACCPGIDDELYRILDALDPPNGDAPGEERSDEPFWAALFVPLPV